MVTYITGCQRQTPQRTECKHLSFEAAWNALNDMFMYAKFPGGKAILSHQSYSFCIQTNTRDFDESYRLLTLLVDTDGHTDDTKTIYRSRGNDKNNTRNAQR